MNAWYGGWESYFAYSGNPADNRLLVQYTSTDTSFSGNDTLTYVVADAAGIQSTGTITITVEPNLAPLASADELIIQANESATFDPLANDSDPEGTPLQLISVSAATAGTVTLTRYIPQALQSEYETNGYEYASIDDFVNSYYGGWESYFAYYGNPADNRMVLHYVRNDPTTAGTDTFTYMVADAAGLQSTGTVHVTLLGDTPPAFEAGSYNFSLAENAAVATSVGTLSATDPDPVQTLVYAIAAGNDAGAFTLDAATGEIRVASSAPLDYEVTPAFVLTITATNTHGLSAAATVEILLTDENDPLQVADATWNLAETAQPADVVGTVSVAQPNAGMTYSYAISAGNDEGLFAIAADTGIVTVSPTGAFDYETTSSYTLTITVSSSDNETTTALAIINIDDVNEAPEPIVPVVAPINKSLDAGSTIAVITATDPEGDSFSFQIISQSDAGTFAIDPISGEIYLADQSRFVAYEGNTFQITVISVDNTTGVSSAPQTIEFEIENNLASSADTGIQLESGYWIDAQGTFILPEGTVFAQSTSLSDTEVIEETSEYNDIEAGRLITYAITGTHTWTLDSLTTITSDGWTYEEHYTSEITTESISTDSSTSSATSNFSYSLIAYWGADYAGYTLVIESENAISGIITETWEETDAEGLLRGGSLSLSWSSIWSDSVTIDSKTSLSDETMTVTTENTFSSEYYAAVDQGAGEYYYDIQGGRVAGTITSADFVTTSGSATVTESKNSLGEWNWDSGVSVVTGATSSLSSYQSVLGDYSFTEEGNTTSGKIEEQGQTSHASNFEVTSHLQADGTWVDVLGNMNTSGAISDSYNYTSSGTYVVEEPADAANSSYNEAGSFDELGSTYSLLTYTGEAFLSSGKWQGIASASGYSASTLSSNLEGVFGTASVEGDYGGATKTTSSYSESLEFNQSAILDDNNSDQSAWNWNNGTAKLVVNDSVTANTTGSMSYSYSLGNAGDEPESGEPSTGPTQTGTVSGIMTDVTSFTANTTLIVHQQLDANSEWQVSSGSKTSNATTESVSGFLGGGGYTNTIEENGQITGIIQESGSTQSTTTEDTETNWDLNANGWGDTTTIKGQSGNSTSSYFSSGSGSYSQNTAEGTITVITIESSDFYSSLAYSMTGSSTAAASSSGSGDEASSSSDESTSYQWTYGYTEASTSSLNSFSYISTGSLNFGGQDGGISGKIDTSAMSNVDSSSYVRSEIQADGSWADVQGFKQTTATTKTNSDFTGGGSFGDQGGISISVSIATRASENSFEHERQEIQAPDLWKITEGKKDSISDNSNSTSYMGGGSIDSGDLIITTTIDGKNDSLNYHRELQYYNINDEQWLYETGLSAKNTESSSENNVEYKGGGSLSGGELPITVTIAGSNNTSSRYAENYNVDAGGNWALHAGLDSNSSSNSMNMTYSGGSTQTMDDGDLFMNITTSVSGGNSTSSSMSESRTVHGGEWGTSNGTESSSNSNFTDMTVHGQGTLNSTLNGTSLVGQITLDSSSKQSFSQDESYITSDGTRTPVSGSKTSSNSQSNGNTFLANGVIDQGDLSLAIVIDQADESKSNSSETHSLVGDGVWANAGGTFGSYSKHKDYFTYNGGGTTTNALDSGELTGSITNNITVSGYDKTDNIFSINGSIAADGSSTITNGTKTNSQIVNSTASTSAQGSFTQPIEGGSITGSISQSSSTYSNNTESITSTAIGNSWSTVGTKTFIAYGNSNYSTSATGSYSISSTSGSGIVTTNTKDGTIDQSSDGDSAYDHNETWVLAANSWNVTTGSKSNGTSSKQDFVKNTTLGNTVIGSSTNTENGMTTTTSVTTVGGGHEYVEIKSSSFDNSNYGIDSAGNWHLNAASNGFSSLLTYDTASSSNGARHITTSSSESSKTFSVESLSSQSFSHKTDSWNSATFSNNDWDYNGGKTVAESATATSSYEQIGGNPNTYSDGQVQNGQITKNEGADKSSITLNEVYSYVSGTSSSGMGDSGSLELTYGKKTSVASGHSFMEWEGTGYDNPAEAPNGHSFGGGTFTILFYENDGYQDSSHDSNIVSQYNTDNHTWEDQDESYSKADSSYYNFVKTESHVSYEVTKNVAGSSFKLEGYGSGNNYSDIYISSETNSKAQNGKMVQVAGEKLHITSSSGSYSSSGSGTYSRGPSTVSISGSASINENSSHSKDRQEYSTWNQAAAKWENSISGSFDNSSFSAFSYAGSASYSYSNSGSWTSEEGHPEHKRFNESSGSHSASEFYSFNESQTASGSFGTKTNGVNWHDETRTSEIVLSDNWTREDKTKQKYIEDNSEWQEPPNYSGSGSGSSDPVLAQTYIRTSETQSHQKINYEVDTYHLATTRVTQNLNGVTDQTSQQTSTTVDHFEGTAVVESYSKSNSGLREEFHESGSLVKTVDRKDEWVNDYTINDSYSPTSAQGSKSGSWTHDWTETVTENGKTTTTADNNAQADNDSYASSGSGGGFHWQAYFHQYQNLRPGTVLPTPPKPNPAPAANAGPSAPTQQSWANWAYHGISAAGEWIYDNASFLGHIALDLFGLIPGIGNAADLLNASWYTWEGDYTNAALSSASAVIGVGIGVTAVKYGNIILQTLPLNAVKNVADTIGTFVGDTFTGAKKLLADQSGAIDVTRLYDGMEWIVAKFTGWGPFGRGIAPKSGVGQLLGQIAGPGQRLAGQIVTKIRRAAGFADEGIPLIIDSNSMRRGMAEQLRARGYNVRTVTEIFGADPGDPAIKSLAETLGGRVLTNNMTDFGRDIAIRIDPRATTADTWIRILQEVLGQ